jgi:hypothetical protein
MTVAVFIPTNLQNCTLSVPDVSYPQNCVRSVKKVNCFEYLNYYDAILNKSYHYSNRVLLLSKGKISRRIQKINKITVVSITSAIQRV